MICLTKRNLVFSKRGRLEEVVARGSSTEVVNSLEFPILTIYRELKENLGNLVHRSYTVSPVQSRVRSGYETRAQAHNRNLQRQNYLYGILS